jgi:hypothetical protein
MSVDQDLMFLRNVIHGAPVRDSQLAARLRRIDIRLNREHGAHRPERHILKSDEYYLALAQQFIAQNPPDTERGPRRDD